MGACSYCAEVAGGVRIAHMVVIVDVKGQMDSPALATVALLEQHTHVHSSAHSLLARQKSLAGTGHSSLLAPTLPVPLR